MTKTSKEYEQIGTPRIEEIAVPANVSEIVRSMSQEQYDALKKEVLRVGLPKGKDQESDPLPESTA